MNIKNICTADFKHVLFENNVNTFFKKLDKSNITINAEICNDILNMHHILTVESDLLLN